MIPAVAAYSKYIKIYRARITIVSSHMLISGTPERMTQNTAPLSFCCKPYSSSGGRAHIQAINQENESM